MFDGRSFAGWRPAAEGTWTIEDGCLKAMPRPALREDLVSTDEFGDFELEFEWKVAPGANSGVKYLIQDIVLVDEKQLPEGMRLSFEQQVGWFLTHRSAKRELVRAGSGAQVYPVAFEYQVIDDRRHPDALFNAASRAGALYRMTAPVQAAARPAGEFNLGRIVLRGLHVEHWLNGVKVVDIRLDDPEVRASIEKRWPADNPVRRLLVEIPKRRSPIALQHHNDAAWFRNIRIRELH
ncbi:MAG: 3-keto-disaccharide hydrolase [Bryobacteraceae bacterium]